MQGYYWNDFPFFERKFIRNDLQKFSVWKFVRKLLIGIVGREMAVERGVVINWITSGPAWRQTGAYDILGVILVVTYWFY